jgi:hypothetical protein
MPDNYWLTGPQGSVFNLGSYLVADPGPDFGTHDLLKAAYAQNSLTEGGELAYESVGVRQFKFPLLLASAAAVPSGLTGAESWLRTLARPGGAFVDVMPEGVATGDMVRFDVLTGRWEPDYSVHVNRAGRRQGNLILDVQPLGYLPTMMILASTASVGLPAQVALSAVPGDYPAQAEVVIQPQSPATQYMTPGGSYLTDGLGWGFSGQPSLLPFLSAASWLNAAGSITPASTFLSPDGWAASQAANPFGPFPDVWRLAYTYKLSADLEPAYRGRFNAYAWLKPPDTGFASAPLTALLDVTEEPRAVGAPMASGNVIATVPISGVGGVVPAPLFGIVPLGPIVLPAAASGLPQSLRLRLWIRDNQTAAIIYPILGGLFLQPGDSSGALPYGLQTPTTLTAGSNPGRIVSESIAGRVLIGAATGPLGTQVAFGDAVGYRGALPHVGASTVSLNVIGLPRPARSYAYHYEVLRDQPDYYYRLVEPSTNTPTLLSWTTGKGGIKHGSWVKNTTTGWGANSPSVNPYFPANQDNAYYQFVHGGNGSDLAVASVDLSNRSFSIEFWARSNQDGGTLANIIGWGGSHAAQQHLQLAWSASNTMMFSLGPGDSIGATLTAGASQETFFRHWVGVVDATSKYMAFYRDGSFVASKAIATTLRQSGTLMFIGKDSLGAASGMITAWVGDVAVYLDDVLPTSRIAAHFAAGASDVHPSIGLYAQAYPQAAAVSVRARPRFQFLRGI